MIRADKKETVAQMGGIAIDNRLKLLMLAFFITAAAIAFIGAVESSGTNSSTLSEGDDTITYIDPSGNNPDVTVEYSGIKATEYNPEFWSGTGCIGNTTSNWTTSNWTAGGWSFSTGTVSEAEVQAAIEAGKVVVTSAGEIISGKEYGTITTSIGAERTVYVNNGVMTETPGTYDANHSVTLTLVGNGNIATEYTISIPEDQKIKLEFIKVIPTQYKGTGGGSIYYAKEGDPTHVTQGDNEWVVSDNLRNQLDRTSGSGFEHPNAYLYQGYEATDTLKTVKYTGVRSNDTNLTHYLVDNDGKKYYPTADPFNNGWTYVTGIELKSGNDYNVNTIITAYPNSNSNCFKFESTLPTNTFTITFDKCSITTNKVFGGWLGYIDGAWTTVLPGDVVDSSVTELFANWVDPDVFLLKKDRYQFLGDEVVYNLEVLSQYAYLRNISDNNGTIAPISDSSLGNYASVLHASTDGADQFRTIYYLTKERTYEGKGLLYMSGSQLTTGTYRSADTEAKPVLVFSGSGTNNGRLAGNVTIDNVCIVSDSNSSKQGDANNCSLIADGHVLILGTGIENTWTNYSNGNHTKDPKAKGGAPQIFGGKTNDSINSAVIENKKIIFGNGEASDLTVNLGTCVIVHSGTYLNIVAGSHGKNHDIGSSTTPLSTYLVLKGGITVDTVAGGSTGDTSDIYGNVQGDAYYGTGFDGKREENGGTFVYVVGHFTAGDDWEDTETGDMSTERSEFTTVQTSIIEGGHSKGLKGDLAEIFGSTHLFISGDSSVWDVQAAGRTQYTATDSAYLEITGEAIVRHVACGTITDGATDKDLRCAKDVKIYIGDESTIANVYGGGYDTYSKPDGRSIETGTITIEMTGGTVGNVFGGGYRGSIGTSGDPSKLSINVTISGGTVIEDVFGGGSGGFDKAKHNNTAGKEGTVDTGQWGDGNLNYTGYSYVDGNITVTIKGDANIKGSVYGGGMSLPYLEHYGDRYYNSYNGSNYVAKVRGNVTVNIMDQPTIAKGVYGGGKGIPLVKVGNNYVLNTDVYGATGCGPKMGVIKTTKEYIKIPWYIPWSNSGTQTVGTENDYAYRQLGAAYLEFAQVEGNVEVHVTNSYVDEKGIQHTGSLPSNIYGGGAMGKVIGNTLVEIKDGVITDNVFGGGLGIVGSTAVTGNRSVYISGPLTNIGGNVYGGSSNGNDGSQADYNKNPRISSDSLVVIDEAIIGGSVFGGGFQGETWGSTSINIGFYYDLNHDYYDHGHKKGDLSVKTIKIDSVFGGGHIPSESVSESAEQILVHGDATIQIYGDEDLRPIYISGSILGDGNSCMTAGNKSIMLNGFRNLAYMNAIHRADELTMIQSSVQLSGRGTDRGMASIYRVGTLVLQYNSSLAIASPIYDVDVYKSLNKDGNPTTSGAPLNTIIFASGVTFTVTDEPSSMISGYTIITANSSASYGAYIEGPVNSTGGFVVYKDGTYKPTEYSVTDTNRFWFISGVEKKIMTMTLEGAKEFNETTDTGTNVNKQYVNNLTINRSLKTYTASIDLVKLLNGTKFKYVGGSFTSMGTDYSGNDFKIIKPGIKTTPSVYVNDTDYTIRYDVFNYGTDDFYLRVHGGDDIYDPTEAENIFQKRGTTEQITAVPNYFPDSNEYGLIIGIGDGDTSLRPAITNDITYRLPSNDGKDLSDQPLESIYYGYYEQVDNQIVNSFIFDSASGPGDYKLTLEFVGAPSNVTAYIGYLTLNFQEVKVDSTTGLTMVANTVEVRVDLYTIAESSIGVNNQYTIKLRTEELTAGLQAGSAEILFPAADEFRMGTLYLEDVETVNINSGAKISVLPSINPDNTSGWMNLGESWIVVGSESEFQRQAVGTILGTEPTTIRYQIENFKYEEDKDQHFVLHLKTVSSDGHSEIISTITVILEQKPEIAVKFIDERDSNTSYVVTKLFPYGTELTDDQCPATGANFVGWYTDPGLQHLYNHSIPLTEDITLYAKYMYQVSFDNMRGTTYTVYIPQNTSGTTISADLAPTLNTTNDGYEPVKWYKEPSYVHEWNFANDTIEGNTTLYAKWTGQEVDVEFYYKSKTTGEWVKYTDYDLNGLKIRVDTKFGKIDPVSEKTILETARDKMVASGILYDIDFLHWQTYLSNDTYMESPIAVNDNTVLSTEMVRFDGNSRTVPVYASTEGIAILVKLDVKTDDASVVISESDIITFPSAPSAGATPVYRDTDNNLYGAVYSGNTLSYLQLSGEGHDSDSYRYKPTGTANVYENKADSSKTITATLVGYEDDEHIYYKSTQMGSYYIYDKDVKKSISGYDNLYKDKYGNIWTKVGNTYFLYQDGNVEATQYIPIATAADTFQKRGGSTTITASISEYKDTNNPSKSYNMVIGNNSFRLQEKESGDYYVPAGRNIFMKQGQPNITITAFPSIYKDTGNNLYDVYEYGSSAFYLKKGDDIYNPKTMTLSDSVTNPAAGRIVVLTPYLYAVNDTTYERVDKSDGTFYITGGGINYDPIPGTPNGFQKHGDSSVNFIAYSVAFKDPTDGKVYDMVNTVPYHIRYQQSEYEPTATPNQFKNKDTGTTITAEPNEYTDTDGVTYHAHEYGLDSFHIHRTVGTMEYTFYPTSETNKFTSTITAIVTATPNVYEDENGILYVRVDVEATSSYYLRIQSTTQDYACNKFYPGEGNTFTSTITATPSEYQNRNDNSIKYSVHDYGLSTFYIKDKQDLGSFSPVGGDEYSNNQYTITAIPLVYVNVDDSSKKYDVYDYGMDSFYIQLAGEGHDSNAYRYDPVDFLEGKFKNRNSGVIITVTAIKFVDTDNNVYDREDERRYSVVTFRYYEDEYGNRYYKDTSGYKCDYANGYSDYYYKFTYILNDATRVGYDLVSWHNTNVDVQHSLHPHPGTERTIRLFLNTENNAIDDTKTVREVLELVDGNIISQFETHKWATPQAVNQSANPYTVEYEAEWVALKYNVTVSSSSHGIIDAIVVKNGNGDNSRVLIDGSYEASYNDRIILNYTSKDGYELINWTINGQYEIEDITSKSTSLIVKGPCSISVKEVGERSVTIGIVYDGNTGKVVDRSELDRTYVYLKNKATNEYHLLEYAGVVDNATIYKGYVPLAGEYVVCLEYRWGAKITDTYTYVGENANETKIMHPATYTGGVGASPQQYTVFQKENGVHIIRVQRDIDKYVPDTENHFKNKDTGVIITATPSEYQNRNDNSIKYSVHDYGMDSFYIQLAGEGHDSDAYRYDPVNLLEGEFKNRITEDIITATPSEYQNRNDNSIKYSVHDYGMDSFYIQLAGEGHDSDAYRYDPVDFKNKVHATDFITATPVAYSDENNNEYDRVDVSNTYYLKVRNSVKDNANIFDPVPGQENKYRNRADSTYVITAKPLEYKSGNVMLYKVTTGTGPNDYYLWIHKDENKYYPTTTPNVYKTKDAEKTITVTPSVYRNGDVLYNAIYDGNTLSYIWIQNSGDNDKNKYSPVENQPNVFRNKLNGAFITATPAVYKNADGDISYNRLDEGNTFYLQRDLGEYVSVNDNAFRNKVSGEMIPASTETYDGNITPATDTYGRTYVRVDSDDYYLTFDSLTTFYKENDRNSSIKVKPYTYVGYDLTGKLNGQTYEYRVDEIGAFYLQNTNDRYMPTGQPNQYSNGTSTVTVSQYQEYTKVFFDGSNNLYDRVDGSGNNSSYLCIRHYPDGVGSGKFKDGSTGFYAQITSFVEAAPQKGSTPLVYTISSDKNDAAYIENNGVKYYPGQISEYELLGDLEVSIDNDLNFTYYVISAYIDTLKTTDATTGKSITLLSDRTVLPMLTEEQKNYISAISYDRYVGAQDIKIFGKSENLIINNDLSDLPPVNTTVAPGYLATYLREGFLFEGEFIFADVNNHDGTPRTSDPADATVQFFLNWTRYDSPAEIYVSMKDNTYSVVYTATYEGVTKSFTRNLKFGDPIGNPTGPPTGKTIAKEFTDLFYPVYEGTNTVKFNTGSIFFSNGQGIKTSVVRGIDVINETTLAKMGGNPIIVGLTTGDQAFVGISYYQQNVSGDGYEMMNTARVPLENVGGEVFVGSYRPVVLPGFTLQERVDISNPGSESYQPYIATWKSVYAKITIGTTEYLTTHEGKMYTSTGQDYQYVNVYDPTDIIWAAPIYTTATPSNEIYYMEHSNNSVYLKKQGTDTIYDPVPGQDGQYKNRANPSEIITVTPLNITETMVLYTDDVDVPLLTMAITHPIEHGTDPQTVMLSLIFNTYGNRNSTGHIYVDPEFTGDVIEDSVISQMGWSKNGWTKEGETVWSIDGKTIGEEIKLPHMKPNGEGAITGWVVLYGSGEIRYSEGTYYYIVGDSDTGKNVELTPVYPVQTVKVTFITSVGTLKVSNANTYYRNTSGSTYYLVDKDGAKFDPVPGQPNIYQKRGTTDLVTVIPYVYANMSDTLVRVDVDDTYYLTKDPNNPVKKYYHVDENVYREVTTGETIVSMPFGDVYVYKKLFRTGVGDDGQIDYSYYLIDTPGLYIEGATIYDVYDEDNNKYKNRSTGEIITAIPTIYADLGKILYPIDDKTLEDSDGNIYTLIDDKTYTFENKVTGEVIVVVPFGDVFVNLTLTTTEQRWTQEVRVGGSVLVPDVSENEVWVDGALVQKFNGFSNGLRTIKTWNTIDYVTQDMTFIADWSITGYDFVYNYDSEKADVSWTSSDIPRTGEQSSINEQVTTGIARLYYNSEITLTVTPKIGQVIDLERTVIVDSKGNPVDIGTPTVTNGSYVWNFYLTTDTEMTIKMKGESGKISFFVNGQLLNDKELKETIGLTDVDGNPLDSADVTLYSQVRFSKYKGSDGWYTNISGPTTSEEAKPQYALVPGPDGRYTYTVTEDVSLYAVSQTFDLNYHTLGGEVQSYDSISPTTAHDKKIIDLHTYRCTIDQSKLERAGSIFIGWGLKDTNGYVTWKYNPENDVITVDGQTPAIIDLYPYYLTDGNTEPIYWDGNEHSSSIVKATGSDLKQNDIGMTVYYLNDDGVREFVPLTHDNYLTLGSTYSTSASYSGVKDASHPNLVYYFITIGTSVKESTIVNKFEYSGSFTIDIIGSYGVAFVNMGEVVLTQTYSDNVTPIGLQEPAHGERTGYIFNGWYCGDIEYDPSLTIQDCVGDRLTATFTADWLKITTIRFINGSSTTELVLYGDEQVGDRLPSPGARAGYTFQGWFLENGMEITGSTKGTDIPGLRADAYSLWRSDSGPLDPETTDTTERTWEKIENRDGSVTTKITEKRENSDGSVTEKVKETTVSDDKMTETTVVTNTDAEGNTTVSVEAEATYYDGLVPRTIEFEGTDGEFIVTVPELNAENIHDAETVLEDFEVDEVIFRTETDDDTFVVYEAAMDILAENGYGLMLSNYDFAVTFDKDATNHLDSLQGDLRLSISRVNPEELTEAQRSIVGNNYAIRILLSVDDKGVSELGGIATITVDHKGSVVYFVAEDGRLEKIDCSYSMMTGNTTFSVGHFSVYMLLPQDIPEPQPVPGTDKPLLFYLPIVILIATLTAVVVIVLRK